MKHKLYSFLSITALAFTVYTIDLSHNSAPKVYSIPCVATQVTRYKSGIEIPAYKACQAEFVTHSKEGRYTYLYDTTLRGAVWVAYTLTANDIDGTAKRSNRFYSDPILRNKNYIVAQSKDYSKSGYDRGHLLPSSDRTSSVEANKATFVLSNCLPQTPALNCGPWKTLEQQLRAVVSKFDTLYIVTGVAKIGPKFKRVGGTTAIPTHFFKAIVLRSQDNFTAKGYIMPNAGTLNPDPSSYRVTIDSIEKMTSLDLFHNLPDDLEERIEKL